MQNHHSGKFKTTSTTECLGVDLMIPSIKDRLSYAKPSMPACSYAHNYLDFHLTKGETSKFSVHWKSTFQNTKLLSIILFELILHF